MAGKYIQSLLWLGGFTGLGYGLLILTTPSEADVAALKKTLSEGPQSEASLKNQQFSNTLQAAAASDKPIYLMSKKELEQLVKK